MSRLPESTVGVPEGRRRSRTDPRRGRGRRTQEVLGDTLNLECGEGQTEVRGSGP